MISITVGTLIALLYSTSITLSIPKFDLFIISVHLIHRSFICFNSFILFIGYLVLIATTKTN